MYRIERVDGPLIVHDLDTLFKDKSTQFWRKEVDFGSLCLQNVCDLKNLSVYFYF